MGREEFIRGLQVPQNKRPQNKRPKRKIKLNQDIKYKRRRFALGVGLTMGLIAASLGIPASAKIFGFTNCIYVLNQSMFKTGNVKLHIYAIPF